MDDSKLILQYLQALHSANESVEQSLHSLLTKPLLQQLNESSDPKETIKLANGSAYLLVSLCFAYLKSQGVNTNSHSIMEDLTRIKAYMKRQNDLEKKTEIKKEQDEESTQRANDFIKAALTGGSTVIVGDKLATPAISFKGTHTKFEDEDTGKKEVSRLIVDKIKSEKIKGDKKGDKKGAKVSKKKGKVSK